MKLRDINKRTLLIILIAVFIARTTFLSMSPAAMAYFAAYYSKKKTRLLAALATVIGLSTALPWIDVAKYIAVIMVSMTITMFIETNGKKISVPVAGGITALSTIAMGITKGLFTMQLEHYIYLALLEGLLVFTVTILLHKGIEYILYARAGQALDNEEMISMALIVGLVLYGIPQIPYLELSVIEAVAYLLILFIAYKFGSGAGAIAGAACGVVLSFNQNMQQLIGIMCMLGILAGIFRKIGKVGAGIAFLISAVACGYFMEEYLIGLYQIRALISAVTVFLLLPRGLLKKAELRNGRKMEEGFAKQNIQSIAKDKLKDFADSFSKLSKTFSSIADTKSTLTRQDINQIFDDLSDKLCKDCENCNYCWRHNFYDTYKAAFTILSSAEMNGTVLEGDVPPAFANQCIHIESFVAETNRGLEVAKINLIWNNRMAESREAIAGQLSEVATIINDFSNDLYDIHLILDEQEEKIRNRLKNNHVEVDKLSILEKRNKKQEISLTARTKYGRCITTREAAAIVSEAIGKRMKPSDGTKNIISKDYDQIVLIEDTNFKTLTGMARATKVNEKISGDNFSFINLNSGALIMTLSDGMGSGEKAYEESESVIELLEQFMEAGFKEESAIKLINSIMVLKSDQQSFSTIDMSIINLFTGMCEFVKIGASATFIKRDRWVETIHSTTLPVGVLNQVDIDGISKKLYDGDYVIMTTDGVLDCIPGDEKEKFIENILIETKCVNPQEIANEILEKAIEQNNHTAIDDMTVIVAGIWKK